MDPDQQREFEERMRAIQDMLDSLGSTLDSFSKSMTSATSAANKATAANNQTTQTSTGAANANTKLQQAYTQADQEISKSSKAMANAFSAISAATLGAGAAFGSLTKTMLSAQEGFGKYGDSIGKFGDAVSSVVKDVPVLGAAFAGVTKILTGVMGDALKLGDQMISLRDNVASVSGALPVTTTELVKLSSNAKYFGENMEKLSKITSGLGQNLTSFGQTAGQGATRMMELAAVTDRTRNEFRNLGYSQEQLTKLQSDYVTTLAQSGNAYALQNKSMAQLRKESIDYAMQINRLSSLTGKSADQLEEEKQQIARARGFQLYAMQEQERAAQLRRQGKGEEAAKVESALENQVKYLQGVAGAYGTDFALRLGEALRTPGGVTPGSVGIANMAPGLVEKAKTDIATGNVEQGRAEFIDQYGQRMRGNIGQTQSVQDLMSPETLNALGFFEGAVQGSVLRGSGGSFLAGLGKATEDQQARMSGAGDQVAQTLNNLRNAELKLQEAYQNFLTKILPDVSNGLIMVSEKLPELANKAQELWDKMGGLTGIVEKLTIAFAGLAAVSVVGPIVSGIIGGILAGGIARLVGSLVGAGAAGAASVSAAGALGMGLRKADLVDKAGKPLGGAALDARLKKLAGKQALEAGASGASKLGKLGTLAKGAGKLLGKLAWPLTAGLALYDAYQGFTADPNASFGTKVLNAGKSTLSGLTFGLLGSSPEEIAQGAGNGKQPGGPINPAAEVIAPNSAEQLMQQNLQNNYLQAILDNTEVLKKVNLNLNTIVEAVVKKEGVVEGGREGVGAADSIATAFDDATLAIDEFYKALTGRDRPNSRRPGGGAGGAGGTGATTGTIDPNAINDATSFFQSKGWTKEQAAGIVGNLITESRLNPSAVGDNGKAYGIAQWHPDRQAQFALRFGKDIRNSTLQEQLEFVDWELRHGNERGAGQALSQATTASEAASIVDRKYERSSGAAISERIANAEAIMSGNLQTGANTALNQFSRNLQGANQSLTTITAQGKSAQVAASAAPAFQALLDYLTNTGYKIESLGGYADRDVRGMPGTKSAHSRGWAIDINPASNALGSTTTDIPMDAINFARQLGLGWGGFWQSRKDPMHFSTQENEGGWMKAAKGGVFKGPKSGYPMELHGTEMVTPLNPNSLLMELGKMPANFLKENTAGVKERSVQGTDFQKIVNRMAETQTTTAAEMINDSTAPIKSIVNSMEKYLEKSNRVQAETLNMLSYKIDEMIDSLQTSNKHTKKIMKKQG